MKCIYCNLELKFHSSVWSKEYEYYNCPNCEDVWIKTGNDWERAGFKL